MKEYKTRKLNRLKEYDYSLNGYYHITVCAFDGQEIFSVIINDHMKINQYGEIVKNTWLQIPNHFANVELDEFIIMPNHIHGIIIINNPVGTRHALSLQDICYKTKNKYNSNKELFRVAVAVDNPKNALYRQFLNKHPLIYKTFSANLIASAAAWIFLSAPCLENFLLLQLSGHLKKELFSLF